MVRLVGRREERVGTGWEESKDRMGLLVGRRE